MQEWDVVGRHRILGYFYIYLEQLSKKNQGMKTNYLRMII